MTVSSQSQSFTTVIDGIHFGECLRWREGLLYFVDMYGDVVKTFDPATGAQEVLGEVFHPGGIGWLPDGRLLAVASEDRLVLEVGLGPDANDPYVDLSAAAPGWANDMLVGRDGRAYVGNFGYDLFAEELRPTRLIMVDADRTVTVEPGELAFPNGMVRRSDGRLVVAETFGPTLALFDVGADGHLTPAGKIALDDDLTPDGICIDAEDAIWLASVLSREVVRVDTEGNAERFPLTQNAYACMLGGEDRRTLYVATAPDHEPASRRAATEGRIEAMRVEVPGAGADGIGA
jgi:sugar lactone lactonase YvrE